MDANQLINNAIQAGGGMLDGKGWFVLEGQVEQNGFRIKPMDQFYTDNIIQFRHAKQDGYVMLGIFASKEAAEEFILTVRTLVRAENGKSID